MAIVHKTASIADYALPIGSNLALSALISDDYDMDGKTARLRVVGSRKAFEISTEDDDATLVIDGQRVQTNSAPDDVATIGQPNTFLSVQKLGVCGWAIDIYDGDELDFRIQGQIEFFDSSGPIPGTFGDFPEIEVSVTPGDALPVTVQVSGVSDYVLPAPTTTTLGGVKRNTGTEGQFVTGIDTDGSLQRATPSAGAGTVTSVAVSGSDGIEIDSGSPITTSGTIALGVNAANLRTHINVADGANAYSHPNHTGDVTSVGDGATTIANGAVTEAKCNSSINASLDLADSSIQPGNAALTDERVPTAGGLTSKFGTNKATIADGDKIALLDSAATDAPKHSLFSLVKSTLKTYFDTLYAVALGADDNYVTDAEKTVIGNTSGTNTGDQDLSGYVLTTAIDTLAELNGIVTDATLIDTNDARLSDARTPTAHSHEGTAILSTGETGGTKFLREDGDGTSSWQPIAGGGDALVGNPLSQFAATTSSQLAGVISDETGSGSLVFATSPTLVTPALGTPSSGTLTNCTGLLIGSTSGLPLKTGTAGVVEAGAFGTAAGEFAQGNDSRFHTRSHTITSTDDHSAGNHKVFYSNGSGQLVELALGADGTVLQSNGATSAPTFEAPAGGGGSGWTLIDEGTANSVNTVVEDGIFTSTYDEYQIVLIGAKVDTDTASVWIKLRASNADLTDYYSTAGILSNTGGGSPSTFSAAPGNAQAYWTIWGADGTNTGEYAHAIYTLWPRTGLNVRMMFQASVKGSNGAFTHYAGAGEIIGVTSVDGFKITTSSEGSYTLDITKWRVFGR